MHFSRLVNCILIDDEPILTQSLQKLSIWEEYGFNLTKCFNNGIEALNYIKNQNDIDVVICDIMMPNISGLDIAEYCYKNQSNIYFVIISAYTDFEHAQKAMRYGVKSYIEKPITHNKLKELFDELRENFKIDVCKNEIIRMDFDLSNRLHNIIPMIFDSYQDDVKGYMENLFAEQNLPSNILHHEASLYKIKIVNMNSYLQNQWKYGKERLYIAIQFIIMQCSSNHYCVIAEYKQNVVSFIAICKSSSKNDSIDITSRLIVPMQQVLKLSCEINCVGTYQDLTELFKNYYLGHEKYNANDIIETAENMIISNYSDPDFSLDTILDAVHLSKCYFCTLFKEITGTGFVNRLNSIRIENAKQLLKNKTIRISSISELVGYKRKSYFYEVFKKYTGLTPAEYQERSYKE